MISILENLLNESELQILKDECKLFKEDLFQIYSTQNKVLFVEDNLKEYLNKLISEVNKSSKKFIINDIWINKISSGSNIDEKYHYDDSDFAVVTYINDDFVGGELEWLDINRNINKIIPKENLTILIPKNIYHRVLPVEIGTRFSLAIFFKYDLTQKKSMI